MIQLLSLLQYITSWTQKQHVALKPSSYTSDKSTPLQRQHETELCTFARILSFDHAAMRFNSCLA